MNGMCTATTCSVTSNSVSLILTAGAEDMDNSNGFNLHGLGQGPPRSPPPPRLVYNPAGYVRLCRIGGSERFLTGLFLQFI
jgi:hypothetical protein